MEDENQPAGAIESIISSNANLARTIVLIGVIFGGIYLLAVALTDTGIELETSNGNKLSFRSDEKSFDVYENILIDPRGWNCTGISVAKGDKIIANATGSVNISLSDMINSSNHSLALRDKYKEKGFSEYTETDIAMATYKYSWCGPEGIQDPKICEKGMKSKRIDPSACKGQLLLAICPAKDVRKIPHKNATCHYFPYNSAFKDGVIATKQGYISLIVNDVVEENSNQTMLNWQDNIGFFSISIQIQKDEEE